MNYRTRKALAADIVAAIDYKAGPLRERIAALEEQTKKLNEAVAERQDLLR
jgi:hypothetical protein